MGWFGGTKKVSEAASPKQQPLSFEQRLHRLFVKHNQEALLPSVRKLLAKCEGREEACLKAFAKKYGPEPALSDTSVPIPTEQVLNDMAGGERHVSSVSSSSAMWRERFERMFRHYDPKQLSKVDDFVNLGAGRETEFMASLVKRYGPEPPAPASPSASASPMASPMVTTAPLVRSNDPRPPASFEERLTRILERYDPKSLKNVPQIVAMSKGREGAIIASLVQRYGPEPEVAEAVTQSSVSHHSAGDGVKEEVAATPSADVTAARDGPLDHPEELRADESGEPPRPSREDEEVRQPPERSVSVDSFDAAMDAADAALGTSSPFSAPPPTAPAAPAPRALLSLPAPMVTVGSQSPQTGQEAPSPTAVAVAANVASPKLPDRRTFGTAPAPPPAAPQPQPVSVALPPQSRNFFSEAPDEAGGGVRSLGVVPMTTDAEASQPPHLQSAPTSTSLRSTSALALPPFESHALREVQTEVARLRLRLQQSDALVRERDEAIAELQIELDATRRMSVSRQAHAQQQAHEQQVVLQQQQQQQPLQQQQQQPFPYYYSPTRHHLQYVDPASSFDTSVVNAAPPLSSSRYPFHAIPSYAAPVAQRAHHPMVPNNERLLLSADSVARYFHRCVFLTPPLPYSTIPEEANQPQTEPSLLPAIGSRSPYRRSVRFVDDDLPLSRNRNTVRSLSPSGSSPQSDAALGASRGIRIEENPLEDITGAFSFSAQSSRFNPNRTAASMSDSHQGSSLVPSQTHPSPILRKGLVVRHRTAASAVSASKRVSGQRPILRTLPYDEAVAPRGGQYLFDVI